MRISDWSSDVCSSDLLIRATIAAGLIAATAMPAAAQFQSHAYQFLKAVRDQDALKAKEFFDKPGSTVVNSRDYSTGETGLHILVKRREVPRSEDSRVGNECVLPCRSRWSPNH